jgi:GNAT superfamily N-acetyltransferase
VTIRTLEATEWDAVAELIHQSTNDWYLRNLGRTVFGDDPKVCRLFPEVYEDLDPGCCLVAEGEGRLIGSCFYHPRETHVGVGIVNVRQTAGGQGVARALMEEVIRLAGERPLRLVSSAMNLDSYSLYTKLGFVPGELYQDMMFREGAELEGLGGAGVRAARVEDVPAMVALEERVSGIEREKDYRYFLQNELGIWSGSVLERAGELVGFLWSVDHPGSRMLGPGVMVDDEGALGLIAAEARRFAGASPLFLVPAKAQGLIARLHACGARNCELHLAQVRGSGVAPSGVVMPTFMPETG